MMAGTIHQPGGFRGRKPLTNLEKANSQASLESSSPRAASFKMGIVDQDDNDSLEKKGDKKKKKKDKKDKKKRDKSEPAVMNRHDSAPAIPDDL